ncbi:MAG: hypothetical protein JO142_02090 [Burkholderiales bacterium]|nr:hypothetical protein [Burkholderiales bacterium]
MVLFPRGGTVRNRAVMRATPRWADKTAIRQLYGLARRLSSTTGELHVVDHIVPLRNAMVCGLHVAANLRVIHWRENAVKGNHTWPEMPFEQLALELPPPMKISRMLMAPQIDAFLAGVFLVVGLDDIGAGNYALACINAAAACISVWAATR